MYGFFLLLRGSWSGCGLLLEPTSGGCGPYWEPAGSMTKQLDRQCHLHVVVQVQRSVVRIVLHANGVSFPRGPPECYLFIGPSQSRVAIKRNSRCHDLNCIGARRGAPARLQLDSNFARATDLPCRRNKITGARAERVIALALFSIHGDGNVFEQIAAALLEFSRVRRPHRRASLLRIGANLGTVPHILRSRV